MQSNSPAAWQNPGGGFGVCPTWAPKWRSAYLLRADPINVYRLNGTTGGGGTPTPTPTGTPAGCSTYTTSTGRARSRLATLTLAAIAMIAQRPFPSHSRSAFTGRPSTVRTSARTAALDLIGSTAPFTHGCLALPDRLWDMAIFPYQDDLRTDANRRMLRFPWRKLWHFHLITAARLTGSLTLNGARCTLPTPLRQRTSQWCFTRTVQASLTSSMAQRPTAALMKPAACKQAHRSGYDLLVRHGDAHYGLKVTYTCAGGGGSPTPTPTARVHRVAARSTEASTRTIRHRLIGSSAAVFRKRVRRARRVRSLVIQLRVITIRTRSPTQPARLNA